MSTITLTAEQTAIYDAGDDRDGHEMLRAVLAEARALAVRTQAPVTVETADGITIDVVEG